MSYAILKGIFRDIVDIYQGLADMNCVKHVSEQEVPHNNIFEMPLIGTCLALLHKGFGSLEA